VNISFSSTARILLGLPHGKALFILSMPRRLKRDSALRITVETYPQASIFNYFALMKVIEHEGNIKETFVGKRKAICDSVINNGLMVIPSLPHHSHYIIAG